MYQPLAMNWALMLVPDLVRSMDEMRDEESGLLMAVLLAPDLVDSMDEMRDG